MKKFIEFMIESTLNDDSLEKELKQLQSSGVIVKLSPKKVKTEKIFGLRDGIEYSFYLNYDNYLKSGNSWDFSSIGNDRMKKEIENPSLVTMTRWINLSDKPAYSIQTVNPLIIHFRKNLNFQPQNAIADGNIESLHFKHNKSGKIGIIGTKGLDSFLKFLSKNYSSKSKAVSKPISKPVTPTVSKPVTPTVNKPGEKIRGPREIRKDDQIESKNNVEFTAYVTAVKGNKVEVEFDDGEPDPLTGWSGGDKHSWCNKSDIRGDSVRGFEVPKWTFR